MSTTSLMRSTVRGMRSTFGDAALAFGATARLTRFVTADTLGEWLLAAPAHHWAIRHEGGHSEIAHASASEDEITYTEDISLDPSKGWRSKLVSGLDCPFCVGTWIGYGVLGSYVLARRRPATLAAWRFVAAGLGLNYLTAHVSSRID